MEENNNYQVKVEKISDTEEDGQCDYTYWISRGSDEVLTGSFTADSDATQEELTALALDEFTSSVEDSDDSSSSNG